MVELLESKSADKEMRLVEKANSSLGKGEGARS